MHCRGRYLAQVPTACHVITFFDVSHDACIFTVFTPFSAGESLVVAAGGVQVCTIFQGLVVVGF